MSPLLQATLGLLALLFYKYRDPRHVSIVPKFPLRREGHGPMLTPYISRFEDSYKWHIPASGQRSEYARMKDKLTTVNSIMARTTGNILMIFKNGQIRIQDRFIINLS